MVDIEKKVELIRAFMQIEGDLNITGTCFNYDRKGGVEFSGYIKVGGEPYRITLIMGKRELELINDCNTVQEIYDCYKEMAYF